MIRVRVAAAILAAMMTQSVGAGVATSAVIEAIPEETETAEQQTEPTYEYVGDYRVTAYAFYEGGGENYYTAGGYEPIPYWTCATGNEFPFGTILFIEGIGEVQVQDRGGFGPGIIDLLIGDDPMSSFEDTTRAVYVVHY